jgi:hypothetical protein
MCCLVPVKLEREVTLRDANEDQIKAYDERQREIADAKAAAVAADEAADSAKKSESSQSTLK